LGDLLDAVTNLVDWERMVPKQDPGGGVAFLEPGQYTLYQPTETRDDIAETNLCRLVEALNAQLPAVQNLAIALSDSNSDLRRAMEAAIRQPPADISATAGFRHQRHDDLLRRLRTVLEATVPEHPRIDMLQGMHDHGCDLIVDWSAQAKYGIQLKNDDDVKERQFFTKTKAQITASHTHGVERLYIVLAGDISNKSNLEKVRQLESEISALNDPYVVPISPERSWNLLFLANRQKACSPEGSRCQTSHFADAAGVFALRPAAGAFGRIRAGSQG
jgi:hypothetical protein